MNRVLFWSQAVVLTAIITMPFIGIELWHKYDNARRLCKKVEVITFLHNKLKAAGLKGVTDGDALVRKCSRFK